MPEGMNLIFDTKIQALDKSKYFDVQCGVELVNGRKEKSEI